MIVLLYTKNCTSIPYTVKCLKVSFHEFSLSKSNVVYIFLSVTNYHAYRKLERELIVQNSPFS